MSEPVENPGFNRRQALSLAARGAVSIYGAGLLAACGGSSGSAAGGAAKESAGPPAGGMPVRGGSLRVGVVTAGNAETVSVPLAVTLPDIIRVDNLYDPLFFVGPHGSVKPGLVTEWHPNKTATVWTFKLRDGVTWHDGSDFSADDVVYTIVKGWGSKENTFNSVLSQFIDFSGVRKRDRLTVEVPLKRAIADFPSTTCIQQTLIVKAGTTDYNKPIGTGPFKFGSFTPGSRSVFPAYANYWVHGQPYVDELVVDTSFSDPNTQMNALLSGAVDIVPGVPPALARANQGSGTIFLGNIAGPGWIAPNFRVDKDPFRDKNVRLALKYIPDRATMVTSAFDGYATAGNDCPGATLKYWASDLKRAHDPEKAKALLKKAGRADLNLTLLASPILPGMIEMATLYASQAKDAGLNIKVQQIDPAIYYTEKTGYLTRDFSMDGFTNGVNSLAMFYLNSLVPGAPFSNTHWGDPKSNALLNEALAELDKAKAEEKWHAVQELQYNDGGILICNNYNWLDGYSRKVRGVKTANAGLCDNFVFRGAWFSA